MGRPGEATYRAGAEWGAEDATPHDTPFPRTRKPAQQRRTRRFPAWTHKAPERARPRRIPKFLPRTRGTVGSRRTLGRTNRQTVGPGTLPTGPSLPPKLLLQPGGLHYTPNSTPSQSLDPAPGRAGLRGGKTETHPGAPRLGPSAPFFCSPRLVLKLSSGVSSHPGVGTPGAPQKGKLRGSPLPVPDALGLRSGIRCSKLRQVSKSSPRGGGLAWQSDARTASAAWHRGPPDPRSPLMPGTPHSCPPAEQPGRARRHEAGAGL